MDNEKKFIMPDEEAIQSTGAKPRFFYGYFVAVAALFIMVIVQGTYSAFGVFFKPILNELGWNRAMTSGAFSLSMIVHGFLGVATGGLTDRFGPRMVLRLCGFLLALGYLLMSQLSTMWQLYLFYGVIIGIGMSGFWVPLLSTVARWFVARRTFITGIVLSGIGIGTLITPPVATRLISIYDWRTSYIIVGVVVLVVVVLAAQFLRRDPAQVGQVPYGESERTEVDVSSGADGLSLTEAVYTRQFWLCFATLLCFGFALFSIMVHLVPHATDLGMSAADAANILAIIGGMLIAGKILLGIAADRIGNRKIFIIGFILMLASFLWLAVATEMWMLYLFAVAFGIAGGGMGAAEAPLAAGLFGLRSLGLIFGVLDLGFTIGAAIGPFMLGYIFDVTGSYQVAFLVCAAISIAGLVSTALLAQIRSKNQ